MKCSVELLPGVDRIYGDSKHPMTEIDVEAEQYLCKVGRALAGGRTVQILETWLDRPHLRSDNEVNIALSSEV